MKGNTFSCQNALALMPVPDLNITCAKLLEWAEPLLTKEELIKTKLLIERFQLPEGDGETLQNELLNWNNDHPQLNWSAPVWKNHYLESRDPLAINSNVFYYLKSKLDEKVCSQANVAAALIVSVYSFIALIDKKELAVDMQKEQPLCMNQYNNLFSAIRIAQPGTDKFKVSSSRQHVVILHNQRIYKLNILDKTGNMRSASAIECDLNCILSITEKGQNIGLLTTIQRDAWAQSRADLLQISANNKNAMAAIEEASFVVCLDQNSPQELSEVSRLLLHGDGKDRFFDKSLQFIVFKNAKTGINFEHTGVDGAVMLRMVRHIYDTIDKVSFDEKDIATGSKEALSASTEEIEFALNDAVREAISEATDWFVEHIVNTQTRVENFPHFGKNQIKQFGISPDAFFQLALQMAEYKLYGKCYSAYEAVMTRTFLDGRIDVLYTVSPESMTFIKSMCDTDCSVQTKIDLLLQAAEKHLARAKECRSGQGVYTHFLALKYHYKVAGHKLGINSLPEIFTDNGYNALNQSVVCTSTTSDYGLNLAGYGPIVDHGYGIRYGIRDDCIRLNMTSRTAMLEKLEQMQIYIEQSLLEMADLMRQRK